MKTFFDFDDGFGVNLNSNLAKQQMLTQEDLDQIAELHHKKFYVLQRMKMTNDPGHLKVLSLQVTELEFALQKAWGFEQDVRYHRWFEVPKCACPKMDNLERLGTDYPIINSNCPIHGSNNVVNE